MLFKTKYMNTTKRIVISWVLLLLLTLISIGVGKYFHNNDFSHVLFVSIVMIIVALKGHQIIDVFMELKEAPTKWRYLLLSYVVVVPLIISLIYL